MADAPTTRPRCLYTGGGFFYGGQMNIDEDVLCEAAQGASWALSDVGLYGGYPGPWAIYGSDVIVVSMQNGDQDNTDIYVYDAEELCAWWLKYNGTGEVEGDGEVAFLFDGDKLAKENA